jgi:hypothetical protein
MKKQYLFIFAALGLISMLYQSCYYDKFDEIHPMASYVNTCDTSLANTYTASVNLIMQVNCVSCHSSSAPSGNVSLDNYSGVKAVAANGSMMGSINHSSGYNAMPPSLQIQSCEIAKLQLWINAGMPQ